MRKRNVIQALSVLIVIVHVITVPAHANKTHSQDLSNKYSMTISGGVSLGIYEAGVNWAILEALRDSGKHQLQSVTGASAGAINTVLTGLRYCEAVGDNTSATAINNLFYQTWNVQLAALLPGREDYSTLELQTVGDGVSKIIEDSIFSRNVYKDRLLEISKVVEQGKYRDGCEVDIAIVVTRAEPEFRAFGAAERKIEVPNQRFIVPLTMKAKGENAVVTGISFKNNLQYASLPDRSSNYIYLPEENGIVSFDTVARTVMASSAFPLVFGRVEMSYCQPITQSDSKGVESSCPADHSLQSNYFIDGGVFDNIPVGATVDLVNARNTAARHTQDTKDTSHSYIFLDSEGAVADHRSDNTTHLKSDYTFEGQLNALAPLLTTLRKQVLAESLADNFGSVDAPQLFLTRRTMPIVGSYLQNFGAFFDKSFFYHDYVAGIYDGINNVVDFLCTESVSNDPEGKCSNGPESLRRYFHNELVLKPLRSTKEFTQQCETDTCDTKIVTELIRAFASRDQENCSSKENFLTENDKGYVNQSLSVFVALCEGSYERFDEFILELDRQRTVDSGVFKNRKWVFGDEVEFVLGNRLSPWTFGFLEKSLQRLLDLETKYDGKSVNTFAASWAMMPSSEKGNRPALQRNRVLAHLSPDYIGIDGLQSGIAVAWDWALPLPELNCQALTSSVTITNYCENYRILVGLGGHFRRVVNERDRFNTTSAYVGIDFSNPDSFLRSSSGLRLIQNADYLPFIDHDTNYESYNSIEIYSRFFGNKIEVSLGFEGNSLSFGQDDLSLRIGLYDVDRFLALMCPACF